KDVLSRDEDWYGNNAAVLDPVCRQVFIVSDFISKGWRECPRCQKSSAEISEEQVKVEWPEELFGSTALICRKSEMLRLVRTSAISSLSGLTAGSLSASVTRCTNSPRYILPE